MVLIKSEPTFYDKCRIPKSLGSRSGPGCPPAIWAASLSALTQPAAFVTQGRHYLGPTVHLPRLGANGKSSSRHFWGKTKGVGESDGEQSALDTAASSTT